MEAVQEVNSMIREQLRDGEVVLWHSWSKPVELLEGTDGRRIKRNWAITLVAFAAFFAFYFAANQGPWDPKVVLLALAIMAAILLAPVMEWRKLKGQQYWITNQRILMNRGKLDVHSLELKDVDAIETRQLPGGTCLLLGRRAVSEGEKQLRWRSSNPATSQSDDGMGMVFYNLDRAEEALELLKNLKERTA